MAIKRYLNASGLQFPVSEILLRNGSYRNVMKLNQELKGPEKSLIEN